MPDFRLARPRSLAEAVAARRDNPDSAWLAGGTDFLVNMRHGLPAPALVIDLSDVAELGGITLSPKGARIGASTQISDIESHAALAERYPALVQAARGIAGPSHRRAGTVGGNLCLDTRCVYYNQSEWWRHANGYCLKARGDVCHVAPQGEHCHAAFSGDLAPALLVHEAELELAGPGGPRRMPLGELFVEDGRAHLSLARDEVVVAVHLPAGTQNSAYRKVRVRDAIDFPLAGVAAALTTKDGILTSLRIALTGTNSRPFLLEGTKDLCGKPVDAAALQSIDKLVQKQVQPMRTTVVSPQYRRLAAAAMACKLVKQLVSEAGLRS